MDKSTKITFTEQSNAVVASVQIEYSGKGVPSNEDILEETKALFNKAQGFSTAKTMQKRR